LYGGGGLGVGLIVVLEWIVLFLLVLRVVWCESFNGLGLSYVFVDD